MASSAFKKALASIEKKAANVIKDVNTNGAIKRLHLDSPRLNYIYGGGLAIGKIHRFMGPESGGKSTICTYIASQLQKHLKDQLGLDKPYVVYIDFERTFDAEHAKDMGLLVDDDHFLLLQPDDIETAGLVLEDLVKTGEVSCVILDSESMATTKTLNDKEIGAANFGNFAKVFGDFLKRFNTLCSNYETTLLIISQERQNMCCSKKSLINYKIEYETGDTERLGTIEQLFEEEFVLICDSMPTEAPFDVAGNNVKIKGFNEKSNRIVWTKILNAFKKKEQTNYVIKLSDREESEQPMAANHSIAIYKHNDGKIDYTFVKDLREGMSVITENGVSKIEKIEKIKDDFTYDITTETGNYYVNGILSHNSLTSHAIQTCVTLDTTLEVNGETMTMKHLFHKCNLPYDTLEKEKFYDISDRGLYTPSYNIETHKVESKQIKALVYKGEQEIYELCGHDGEILLRGTAAHRVWDCRKKEYIPLGKLSFGYVMNKDLKEIEVTAIPTGWKEPIVDIQVDEYENYFTDGILSHNTGGFLLKYSASTLMRVKKIDTIKVDGKDAGIYMNVRNYKNKTGIPWRECDMMLYFKNGFDSNLEYVDFIKEFSEDERLSKYVKVGGAYYKSEEFGFSICGKDKFLEWVSDPTNSENWEKIKSIITEIVSNTVESDKNHNDPELEKDSPLSDEVPEITLED